MCGFVHLHNHSEYSLLDGASRIKDMTAKAAQLGMKALALTDHGVMYGAIPFYKACRERGIKPIIGMEAYVAAGSRLEKASRRDQPIYHLTLLAKNAVGYRNLMKLSSIGHLEGFHYRPRIDFEALSGHAEGLVCLSGCMSSELSQHLLQGRDAEARETALRYRELFGEDYFLEIQDHGLTDQKRITTGVLKLSDELGIPLAATNDSHYLNEEDHVLQDVLICIGTGKTVDDQDRFRIGTSQLYMKTGEEMSALFRHRPEAVTNTALIADRCELEIDLGAHILPKFSPIPEGMTAETYLAELCLAGLRKRYGETAASAGAGGAYVGANGATDDAAAAETVASEAEARLRYELDVIARMGFSNYFLIVWDFIRYAREQGIAVGPGRGSSAGSIVAYSLRITDVDPLKHKLLFERFLNPERVSMPDIDVDFSDERRDEVIRYVAAKYGRGHVAQIITFGTLAARAAVRDVGRVLNLPYGDVDRAAKLIPGMPGMSIERAAKDNPDFRALTEKGGPIADLIAMARRAEGMPRHASTHAAGVVISSEPLTDYVPLQEGAEGVPLTQYSMEHLEAVGLLKMDFLGLRNLSIIERAMQSVLESTGHALRWEEIPYDDPATYELLGRGDTTGVFQMESAGVRRVLRDMKPKSFEDIVSVVALYRPGPMDFIPQFIKTMHGEIAAEYPHPDLEPILRDTHGIIVYQEQIMQIASRMAGFSLGEADLLRRAVGKKKREILDEQRAHFVKGSQGQGYTDEEANRVYDMILRFADYGFPRAHAAAYGVLAFQTAYLKAHYPVPFMASMLTSIIGNQRKTAEYVDECRRMGIPVLPPDVNESRVLFTPVCTAAASEQEETRGHGAASDDPARAFAVSGDPARTFAVSGDPARSFNAIRFGLAAVKNVGTQAIESIMKERTDRPFESLSDLCRRVDPRACNKRVLESLLLCGALDALPGHRAQLLAALDESVEAAAIWRKEKEELQLELFDLGDAPNWEVDLPEVAPYTQSQTLELERELLGLYLSGHPLDAFDGLWQEAGLDRLADLAEAEDGAQVVTAGMVVSLKPIVAKSGQAMAFLELEDRIMGAELVVFPSVWKSASAFAGKGALLLVRAKLQQGDEDFKLLADEIVPLAADTLRREAARMRRGGPGGYRSGGTRPGADAGRGADRSEAKPAAAEGARRTTSVVKPAASPDKARAGSGEAGASAQRFYVRIDAGHEAPSVLKDLQALLARHKGPLQTVLFYERERKSLALNDSYRVLPSAALTASVERLLGEGTAKVK
ncbi:DNA polymerase III subunit alpha [Cohnella hashimotonis]|uniref:DNA-directed DNA polymerase n=1 Tax=Cohnella hashimotonis TaxID=2826895 RepID=A0ABT6TE12_9BACL|nr:DNA polymerase III subunit alpha [Cohnella hashimotonis]MDI4644573.1 DNA polymerase III subunit alpha [Cohnella hashimotonis]